MYRVTLINENIETVIHSELSIEGAPRLSEGFIKEAINTINSFTFIILPNNPGYDKIFAQKTLVEVLNTKTNQLEFEGRILLPSEKMGDDGLFTKRVVCESEMGYLQDSTQRYGEYRSTPSEFFSIIIENHNRQVEEHKRFEVGLVDVTNSTDNVYRYLGYEKTFPTLQDKLLDRLGGEIRLRKENGKRYLDWVTEIGEVKNTEIRIAKNLLSIEKEQDPTEIITRLVPLGETIDSEEEDNTEASKPRLSIASVNNGIDYIDDEEAIELFGIIEDSVIWDDVTIAENLLNKGQEFLMNNNRIRKKYILSALDLFLIGLDIDSYEVGNWYPVINPVMGIDEHLRVIEKTTDILSPYNSSLSIGDKFKTLNEYQSEMNRSTQKIVELESRVIRQSQNISALKNELQQVDQAVQQVKFELEDGDLPALEDAIDNLNQAVDNLIEAIDAIPVYGPATQTEDGLMSATDKTKLDGLQSYDLATETTNGLLSSTDKQKINLISVTSLVDLDDLLARVEALENGNG